MTGGTQPSEEERLASLRSYGILGIDTDNDIETESDSEIGANTDEPLIVVCQIAVHLCGTPIAAVNLVDETRVWSLASVGWPPRGRVDRRRSFTADVVANRAAVVVRDSSADERYADIQATLMEPYVRSYAGAPLTTHGGLVLGALCVMDVRSRDFSGEQVRLLAGLADLAMAMIELRRLRLIVVPLMSVASEALADRRAGALTVPALEFISATELKRLFPSAAATNHGEPTSAEAREMPGLAQLTLRELDIVDRLVRGDRVPAIAEMLFLSQSTVRNHLSSVFRKLRVASQQELLDLLRGSARQPRAAEAPAPSDRSS